MHVNIKSAPRGYKSISLDGSHGDSGGSGVSCGVVRAIVEGIIHQERFPPSLSSWPGHRSRQ